MAVEAHPGAPNPPKRRFFVGFFGITRSLRYTAESIHDNVLSPLHALGGITRLYGHFHLPDSIDNPRSGEAGLPVDAQESALLRLDACLLDPQHDRLIADELAAARRYPDLLCDDYRSVRNLCFQLRSLARLWTMMATEITSSAASCETWVMFLRPDLRYLDPFPWTSLLAGMQDQNADLAVPAWHDWGGLNDRFAVATPRAAAVYATRGDAAANAMAARGGLHGESLLKHAASAANLRVLQLPVRAVRVRAHGVEERRDLAEFGL